MGDAVKHIVSNNDRSHVIYWIRTHVGVIRRCSEPNCEVNAETLSRSQGEKP